LTAVSADGVALSLVCDGCGRIERLNERDDEWRQDVPQWDLMWPQLQRAGWRGSPLAVGQHYCPLCQVPAQHADSAVIVTPPHGWMSLGEVDGIPVLALGGDLDLAIDAAFTDALDDAVAPVPPAEGRHVLLSMANVNMVDSTVLGTMVRFQQRLAAAGGVLALVSPPARVRRVLEVLGLAEVFPVYPDLESAVQAATPRRSTPQR